jgi:nicotinate-nucleotide adenylyltransferase
MSQRIGILGGTFDPIHRGHIDVGDAAQRALGLGTLYVVPLNTAPHRSQPAASGFHRFAMAALAVAGRPAWQVSDVELVHTEPSYTATTLRRFHDRGYAPADLFFVSGVDAFVEIRSWKDYPHILDMAQFAVVTRPGFPVGELRDKLPELASRMTPSSSKVRAPAGSIILIDAQTADVSSTVIRQRCVEALPLTGFVPTAVQQHIEQHGLYRSPIQDPPPHRHAMDAPAGRLHGQS